MMMRSMPPASAHLALMPVPAPPPMIGLPAAIWARRRARHASRVKKLMPTESLVAGTGAGLRNSPATSSRAAVISTPSVAMTSGVCQRTRSLSGL